MIRNILAAIGIILTASLIFIYLTLSPKIGKLDSYAIPLYTDMIESIIKDGDFAKTVMKKYKIAEDITNEDVIKSIKSITKDKGYDVMSDVKMFRAPDAKDNEVKFSENIEICNLYVLRKLLDKSMYIGGMMPCSIMLVEYGNGDRFLITRNFDFIIHGGFPLDKKLLKLLDKTKENIEDIVARATIGDM